MDGTAFPTSSAQEDERDLGVRRRPPGAGAEPPRRSQREYAEHRQPGTKGRPLRLGGGRRTVVLAVPRRPPDRALPAPVRRGADPATARSGHPHHHRALPAGRLPQRVRGQVASRRLRRAHPLRAARAPRWLRLLDGLRRQQQPGGMLRVRDRAGDTAATPRLRNRLAHRPAREPPAAARERKRRRLQLPAVLRRPLGAAAARPHGAPDQPRLPVERAAPVGHGVQAERYPPRPSSANRRRTRRSDTTA